MLVVLCLTVIGVIPMKRKLNCCDQISVSQIVGNARRQKMKKEGSLAAINTTAAFLEQLQRLLSEALKCTKALSQLVIAILLMLELCKEQHTDRARFDPSGTKNFDMAVSWMYPRQPPGANADELPNFALLG